MNKARQPLVSVCMSCYNAGDRLRAAIQGILAQDYPSLEIVAVDDGSTDSTAEILASFDKKVRWEAAPHRGQSAGVNRAVALSTGAFINFHDADDTMCPAKISLQVRAALTYPGAVVYGPWRRVVELQGGGQRPGVRQPEPLAPGADLLREHLKGWFCPPHSYLWPREVVERVGPWDETLIADKDGDFAMRALVQGVPFVYCPQSWVDYVSHGGARVSRSRSAASARSRAEAAAKIARFLEDQGRLDQYRDAVAYRYDSIAHAYWSSCPEQAAMCAREARRISRSGTDYGSLPYRTLHRTFGLAAAEVFYSFERRLQRILSRLRPAVTPSL